MLGGVVVGIKKGSLMQDRGIDTDKTYTDGKFIGKHFSQLWQNTDQEGNRRIEVWFDVI